MAPEKVPFRSMLVHAAAKGPFAKSLAVPGGTLFRVQDPVQPPERGLQEGRHNVTKQGLPEELPPGGWIHVQRGSCKRRKFPLKLKIAQSVRQIHQMRIAVHYLVTEVTIHNDPTLFSPGEAHAIERHPPVEPWSLCVANKLFRELQRWNSQSLNPEIM